MDSLKITKKIINDEYVEKIPGVSKSKYKPLGYKILPFTYGTIVSVGSSGAGKTTAMYKMVKESVGPNTEVIFFVGSLFMDKSYQAIVKWLKKNEIMYVLRTDLGENPKNDQLQELMDYLANEIPNDEWEDLMDPTPKSIIKLREQTKIGTPAERPKIKRNTGVDILTKKKEMTVPQDEEDLELEIELTDEDFRVEENGVTYEYPRYIFIIDDLTEQTRRFLSPRTLPKKLRHFKAKLFLNVQDVTDLSPDLYENTNVCLAFSEIPYDKKSPRLQKLYANLGLSIGLDVFLRIYLDATESDDNERSRNFLYINRYKPEFRKNFNVVYDLKKIKRETTET